MKFTTRQGIVFIGFLVALLATMQVALAVDDLEIVEFKGDSTVIQTHTDLTVKPSQQVAFSLTLKNNLPDKITGIAIALDDEADVIVHNTTTLDFLSAGETKTVTFVATVPYQAANGTYAATLTVQGLNLQQSEVKMLLAYQVLVKQEFADVIIDAAAVEDATLSCKEATTVSVNYINIGLSNESDIIVSVKGGKVNVMSDKLSLEHNQKATVTLTVPAVNLSAGANTLTVALGYRSNAYQAVPKTVTLTKNLCVTSVSPVEGGTIILGLGKTQTFKVTLAQTGFTGKVQWTVNDSIVHLGEEFTFSSDFSNKGGDYTVKAAIAGETKTWKITVVDRPQTKVFTTNIPATVTKEQLSSFSNLVVENSFGKVEFSGVMDLTTILDLDKVMTITEGVVAVDSTTATALNKPATVTLKKTLTKPVLLYSTGFNSGTFQVCPSTMCTLKSNANGQVVFSVTQFSTYMVAEEQTAVLTVSDILIETAERGKTVNTTFKVKNEGTAQPITNMVFDVSSINAKYSAKMVNLPTSLQPAEEKTVQLTLTIPNDEAGGKHSIGDLKITSTQVNKTVPITINPKSFLVVEEFEINGDSTGDLSIDDVNKIMVRVQNDYTDDMKDVRVTVTIKDVDGEDFEEESDEFDLDKGEDHEATLEFDVSSEEVDKNEYKIKIVVEGEADDDTKHKTIEEKTVDVDRKTHEVIITNVNVGATTVDCIREIPLQVRIENIGKSNEDEVTVRVKNTALGLNLEKKNIDLDKFSGSDNEYTVPFVIQLENAKEGTYPLTIEVVRDGDVEDTETATITVKMCTPTSSGKTQEQLNTLGSTLVTNLKQGLETKQSVPVTATTISGSFREMDNYVLLLGVLTFLVFLALVLGIAVLATRKRS